MVFITVDDITDIDATVDAEKIIKRFYAPAYRLLNQLTCNAITPQNTGLFTGIVADDGVTVRLPYWVTAITSVESMDGTALKCTFTPTHTDPMADGDVTAYGNTITLADPMADGDVITIIGIYGFDTLPSELTSLLAYLTVGYSQHINGDNDVTSKSIEDVSVTTADHSTDSPARLATDVYNAAIDYWSLCPTAYDGVGTLAMPRQHHELPYWLTDAEILGGNYAYGSR